MRDLWKSGVSGELRYLGASGEAFSPNMRPEKPTIRPALSAMGNMMRLRNLSVRLPLSFFLATPASSISRSVNFFDLRKSEIADQSEPARPRRNACTVASVMPRSLRYFFAASERRDV